MTDLIRAQEQVMIHVWDNPDDEVWNDVKPSDIIEVRYNRCIRFTGGSMSVSLENVEQQARQLSADDRARLAELLLESLQGQERAEIDDAWNREIALRVAAFDRGESPVFPAEDVFAEARPLSR